jgi:hypothetical protein
MMLKNYNSESKKYIKQSKILFTAAVSVTSFDNNSSSSTTSISYIKWQKRKSLLILENNIFKLNKTTVTTKYLMPSESKWLQHSDFSNISAQIHPIMLNFFLKMLREILCKTG